MEERKEMEKRMDLVKGTRWRKGKEVVVKGKEVEVDKGEEEEDGGKE